MNVLVIGSGGREHAICWALAKSRRVSNVVCVPGNVGIASEFQCVPCDANDVEQVAAIARDIGADLVIIGPEGPLVTGLADHLRAASIPTVGPSKAASQLESSKSFTKSFCARHGIPTASYRVFDSSQKFELFNFLSGARYPLVLKADGLAAGKGVIIADGNGEARQAAESMFDGKFGAAGDKIVVEEFLKGTEASFFALCDGHHVVELGTAQDHKRAYDGDNGPNTGGMGASAPASSINEKLKNAILDSVIIPTVSGMGAEGMPYCGILYAGLMLCDDGPRLIEYNVRFGDPECQAIMPLISNDIAEIFWRCANGKLEGTTIEWDNGAAVTIVLASDGYPGKFSRGTSIERLDALNELDNILCFHAGTAETDGNWVSNSGRVVNVTAMGMDLEEARRKAYQAISVIDWPDGFYRNDIALGAI